MHRVFADKFDFSSWQDTRAQQFAAPNDAFQQLVGDGLRACFGAFAWVASTAGRDGGIDARVDSATALPHGFPPLSCQFIVECKWHDDGAKDPKSNILQEWRRVREKVKNQAASGWQGAYEPWQRANGYLYCIAIRFPDAAFRDTLRDEIRDFFDSLPAGQRPPIARDAIHVWDWADIAAWLRNHQRLADLWLGVQNGDLVDHGRFRARLAHRDEAQRLGFRGYLLAENLPFVAPADDDPCHPDRLFVRLRGGENLLLLGEGGVGKTRTSFEVAERADRAGWRVLHLDPPEIGIDPRHLLAELACPGDTLVVVDYIDKIQNFDARYWRETLLPEVARRDGRLRLIANARPADSEQMLQAIAGSGLFADVPLALAAERRQAVAQAIEDALCPKALAALGRPRVAELCGSRPIIAMFVARELEALAESGQLASGLANAPRPGELIGWLSRRLDGAELLHQPPASRWDATPPQPSLCAAVAILAAAPTVETELIQVAAATLTAAGGNAVQAERCIDLLRQGGWLEMDDAGFLRTPHDIVADETLARLLDANLGVLPWLLAAAPQGRPLGHFALALGRLHGNSLLNERSSSAVTAWLTNQSAALGSALVEVRSDIAAYALGAVFECPYWVAPANASWSTLVAPWLKVHGTELSARHLLHRGLGMPGVPTQLRAEALAWLARHGQDEVAGFVLGPLLAWKAERLCGDQETVCGLALVWLDRNGMIEDARYVLAPLLAWEAEQLGGGQETVRQLALVWLDRNGTTEAAQFVLAPLLAWEAARLDGDQETVRQLALVWLDRNGTTKAAGFVLPPLLAWKVERLGRDQEAVRRLALVWLDRNGIVEDAQFVLAPLLAWEAEWLGGDQETVRQLALAWLDLHGTTEAANFTLPPLLAWKAERLDADQETARQLALAWLGHHGATETAQFVLAPLLAWEAERLDADQETARQLALAWLGHHGATETAQFVLAPLLAWEAERLGGDTDALVGYAKAWLVQFRQSSQADFVLAHLLNHPQLGADMRRQFAEWAIAWLTERLDDGETTHLLKALLQVASWYGAALDPRTIILLTGHWLDRHLDHAERPYVSARLLRLPQLPDRAWIKVAVSAMEEMDRHAGSAGDDYLLSSVVNRLIGLRQEHQALWLRLVRRWIAVHGDVKTVSRFLWRLRHKSSRVIDRHCDLLWPECTRRFGPSFEIAE